MSTIPAMGTPSLSIPHHPSPSQIGVDFSDHLLIGVSLSGFQHVKDRLLARLNGAPCNSHYIAIYSLLSRVKFHFAEQYQDLREC
jgi:hypothetical protein